MSHWIMHKDATVFPEPFEFRPERFLGAEGQRIEKYLVPFSKGTHNCVGQKFVIPAPR
jgi:cytochrome P450